MEKIVNTDGSIYIGEVQNNIANGFGKITYPDKSSYTGEFKDGKYHGVGIYEDTYKKYAGEFINGKSNGIGIEKIDIDGRGFITYCGEFERGLLNGCGFSKQETIYSKNVIIETGMFKDKELHGVGTFVSETGSIYSGEFKNNKKHGIGTISETHEYNDFDFSNQEFFYLDNISEEYYSGQFNNDIFEGVGTKIQRGRREFPNVSLSLEEVLSGQFELGNLQGIGTSFEIVEGELPVIYSGEFEKGKLIVGKSVI